MLYQKMSRYTQPFIKTLVFLFLNLVLLTATTTEQARANELNDGFLAVGIKTSHAIQTLPDSTDNLWNLEFYVEGSSPGYEIQTRIEFVPELLNIGDNYDGDSTYVPSGMIHRYGLANLEVLNLVKAIDAFGVFFGARFGHYGFLIPGQTSPSFIIHFSPKLELALIMGKYFRVKIPVEMPIVIIKENLNSLFLIKTGVEFTFDPLGSIATPNPDTALYSIGVDYEYFQFDDSFLPTEVVQWRPYFKVSILY